MDPDDTQRQKPGLKDTVWRPKAKVLFLNGFGVTAIARKLGVARETVSRVKARERWDDDASRIRAEVLRATQEAVVRDNVAVLREHDEVGGKLLQAAKLQIDAELLEGEPSLRKLRDAAIIAAHGAEMQRAARAIRPDQSFVDQNQDPPVVTLVKGLDASAFEVVVKALGGDRARAQEAIRRATEDEMADTA